MLWEDTMITTPQKEFILNLQYPRVKVHDHHGRKHDSRESGMVIEQYLDAEILIFKQESKKAH